MTNHELLPFTFNHQGLRNEFFDVVFTEEFGPVQKYEKFERVEVSYMWGNIDLFNYLYCYNGFNLLPHGKLVKTVQFKFTSVSAVS